MGMCARSIPQDVNEVHGALGVPMHQLKGSAVRHHKKLMGGLPEWVQKAFSNTCIPFIRSGVAELQVSPSPSALPITSVF